MSSWHDKRLEEWFEEKKRIGRRHLLKGATGAALMSVWTVNCSSSDGFNNSALDWQPGGVGEQAVSGSWQPGSRFKADQGNFYCTCCCSFVVTFNELFRAPSTSAKVSSRIRVACKTNCVWAKGRNTTLH